MAYSQDKSVGALRRELDRLESKFGIGLAKEEYARRASAGSDGAPDLSMHSRIVGKEIVDRAMPAKAKTDEQKARIFAETLKGLSADQRKHALEKYYADRKSWADVCSASSTPKDFLDWANKAFPFRRIIDLRFNDLAHLDSSAHNKIKNWRKTGSGVAVPNDLFGFPRKNQSYDPDVLLKIAPTASEVHKAFKRGDPKASEMKRLNSAAAYHRK